MPSRIVAMGTAVPPARFTQAEVLALTGYRDRRRRGFFRNSGIATRHLAIEPGFRPAETADQLHERYAKASVRLGREAARRCLEEAGTGPEAIDCLVTTSCTGWTCPGLDSLLARELHLRPGLFRSNLLMMGCSSAVSALQVADAHVRAYPGHRALVVAVEVCSATYFFDDTDETAVAHAIFGDGAAAALVTGEGPGPEIVAFQPLLHSEYLDRMGWTQVDGRFRIVLAKEVRDIAPAMLGEVLTALLGRFDLRPEEIRHWVLHSAGRAVLDRARCALRLREEDLLPSRSVLRRYGNLSSATVLFVLDEVRRTRAPRPQDLGFLAALGPGFAAESALLRW